MTDRFRTPRYVYVGSNQVCWLEADAPFDSIDSDGNCFLSDINPVALEQDMERSILYVLTKDLQHVLRVTIGVKRANFVPVLRRVTDLKGIT